jgi:hypothetical protein
MRAVQPVVERLSQLLRVESLLADATARTEAQQLATRIHTPLQQLYAICDITSLNFNLIFSGIAQNILASRVAAVRVNDTPGSARFQGIFTVVVGVCYTHHFPPFPS